MSLVDIIRNRLSVPLSPFGEAAVRAFATLPGMSDWTPPGPFQPADAQRIVELGWPFASLGQNPSLDHILRKGVSGKFKTDDFSVIHAGALLTKLGGRVEFLKERPESRSADIRVWFADAPVDAEVTTAEVKVRQEELRGFITALTQAIGIGSTPWNPLIHLGEMPVPEVQTQIVDAVLALGAGGRAGVPDLWDVYAVPLQEEQAFVDPVRFAQLRPTWWKNDGPSLVNTGLTLSSDPSDIRRIHVASKLPFLSYLNQICNKADRPQRNQNNPFLVILDQGSDGAMPMRHQRIRDELRQWLPIWPQVSGVLCFDQRPYAFGNFCWKLSFHPNPDAVLPLPAALLALTPCDVEICECPFEKWESEVI